MLDAADLRLSRALHQRLVDLPVAAQIAVDGGGDETTLLDGLDDEADAGNGIAGGEDAVRTGTVFLYLGEAAAIEHNAEILIILKAGVLAGGEHHAVAGDHRLAALLGYLSNLTRGLVVGGGQHRVNTEAGHAALCALNGLKCPARQQIHALLRALGLLGSEGCTPEMRDQIEKNWGMFVTDNYGMSELMGPGLSGECRERVGQHINEDMFLFEVIDRDTLEPIGEGQTGEIVVTTLIKEGIPLLRYRTKDISEITYEPCKCGRTTARMAKVKGRSDDMLKIRGVNVFPSQVESVLVGMEEVSPHYQLVVRREGFADTLEVRVELTDGRILESYSGLEKLHNKIKSNLKSVLGLDAKVSLVQPKTIERFQGKAVRVVDLRGKKE